MFRYLDGKRKAAYNTGSLTTGADNCPGRDAYVSSPAPVCSDEMSQRFEMNERHNRKSLLSHFLAVFSCCALVFAFYDLFTTFYPPSPA